MKGTDKMKALLLIAVVLILFALDRAALHDILKGKPDLYGNSQMLVFGLILFGLLISVRPRRKIKGINLG